MVTIYTLDGTELFNGTRDDLQLAQERGNLKGRVFAARTADGLTTYHAPCYGLPVTVTHPDDLPRMEVETMRAIIDLHSL